MSTFTNNFVNAKRQEMTQRLWELSSCYETANEAPFEKYFSSWTEFIESKEWERNWISGCKPVHWNWCDVTDEDYDGEDDEDYLDLVWLSLAPCNARLIHIYVKKEDETSVRNWLLEHGFLAKTDDV